MSCSCIIGIVDSKPHWTRRAGAIEERSIEDPPRSSRFLRDYWFLIAGIAIVIAAASTGVFFFFKRQAAQPKPAPAPVKVEIPAGTTLSFSGTVEAATVVSIGVPVAGTVESLQIENGAEVEEGQLLARIRNEGLEAERMAAQEELEQAQTRLNNLESTVIAARLEASRAAADADRARTEFDRIDKTAQRETLLFKEGATPRLKYEKSQKDLANARAEYDTARDVARRAQDRAESVARDVETSRKELDRKANEFEATKEDAQLGQVHAPVSGTVIGLDLKLGGEVDVARKDLILIALDATQLRITIEPDPKVKEKLRDGLPALVQVLETSSDGLDGTLRLTEDGEYRVEFRSEDRSIKPGMSVVVKVKLP